MTPSAVCSPDVRSAPSLFTGKERDAESGNDYFEARYYSSAMGRFLSPDWSAQGEPVPYASLDDPQTLNLYTYVRNNPLTSVDPDGHAFCPGWCDPNGQAYQTQSEIDAAEKERNAQRGYGAVTNAERDQRIAEQRSYLINIAGSEADKENFASAPDSVIFHAYMCSQKPGDCGPTTYDPHTIQLLKAAATMEPEPFGPEDLHVDSTGRIHTSLPDRIPDGWSRAELEQARDQLKQSIKARIRQGADHGGADLKHMARIRQEQQLLRQVESKLGSK
jgi:RHS repeat-associated protein